VVGTVQLLKPTATIHTFPQIGLCIQADGTLGVHEAAFLVLPMALTYCCRAIFSFRPDQVRAEIFRDV
jgi:hypothetical protein